MFRYKLFVRSSVLFILFFSELLFTAQAVSQNYIWPTDASKLLTSSFCEFRPRHYHAAIDIKTWNRTGYRIFAIDDGYIMRVRVSAFGYGKAVYLRLKDGNVVVYAHLSRFWPELENYVNSIRERDRQFRLDLHLNSQQFPVTKGQLIAYSGKSGIGYPHLHFEIRNPQNKPINPLPFYQQTVQDNIPPKLFEAAFFPMDYRSLINQKDDTVYYEMGRRQTYTVADTLNFSGRIGLAMKVWDQAEGASNLYSFYLANMWIDDSLVYHVKYDIFSYAQSKKIELDKNFALWRKNIGIFHNFYRHPLNTLSHYGLTPANGGLIDTDHLEKGLHTLRIEIRDFAGNSAHFRQIFRSGPTGFLTQDLNRWLEGDIFLRIQSDVALDRIRLEFRNISGQWYTVKTISQMTELYLENLYHYTFSISLPDTTGIKALRITGQSRAGIPTYPLYLLLNGAMSYSGEQDIIEVSSLKVKKDWLEIKARIHYSNPVRLMRELNKKVPNMFWFPRDHNECQIHLPLATAHEYISLFERLFKLDLSGYTLVRTQAEQKVFSEDHLFEAYFPVSSLYDQSIVYIKQRSEGYSEFPVKEPYLRIGKIYDLQPFDEAVDEGVWVSLRPPVNEGNLNGLGLYYWNPKKGWGYIPARTDSSKLDYTARVTSLEKFTLIQDTIPPVVYPVQKTVNNSIISDNGQVSFMIKDEMSGIAQESQIQVRINGRWQLFEYDNEEDLMSVSIPESEPKPVSLEVNVSDNLQNRTIRKYSIE